MTLAKTFSVLAQGKIAEDILQIMLTADRLNMPKILACCERHVAMDPANSMRTKAFWERIPACSSLRIAKGLEAAHGTYKAHAMSIIRSHKGHPIDTQQAALNSVDLEASIPPARHFFKMAEPVLSQEGAYSQN